MTKHQKPIVHTTKDRAFEYGFVRSPSGMVGRMEPFRPHWWAQYLGDGTQETFDSRLECISWIRSWRAEQSLNN